MANVETVFRSCKTISFRLSKQTTNGYTPLDSQELIKLQTNVKSFVDQIFSQK